MITLERQIDREDVYNLSTTLEGLIYHSLGNYQFLHILYSFLESSINISNFSSPKDKLDIINFLDKMNRYRESLEIKNGTLTIEDLKIAANRFGNKAQSAFDTEIEE